MKPVNQSDIKKQRLLFSLSLLSLVVAVGLFTSAFFWSANSEIEWTTDLRKEHLNQSVHIDSLKQNLNEIKAAVVNYEGIGEGLSNQKRDAMQMVLRKIEKLKSIPDDQANLKSIALDMNTLLSTYFEKQEILNDCLSAREELKTANRKLERDLEKCEDELSIYRRTPTSPYGN